MAKKRQVMGSQFTAIDGGNPGMMHAWASHPRPKTPTSSRARVSAKIDTLRGEGVPQKQAVAMALNMERAGRLTAGGGYKRVGKKRGGR